MISLLKRIDGFTPGARLDWLHTTHGPFPDFAAEYEDDGQIYTVGVWSEKDGISWVCVVEGPDDVHSGILMSYRWFRNKNDVWCSVNEDEEFCFTVTTGVLGKIMDRIARESIHAHIVSDLP